MRGLFLAILLTAAGLAHADGSAAGSATGSDAGSATTSVKKPPEEAPVDPTGLIIAGVALAAFAVLLLVGRRKKKEPQTPAGELAEVRLVIETDERATVWTQPSLKLHTDRIGEVVLHLPVGTHEVHVEIGPETYTRTIQVSAIKRMRLPINFTKERIARAASGEMQAVSPPSGKPQTTHVAGLSPRTTSSELSPQKTSMARAFPDSSTQSALGKQLAGLIDVELDTPKPDGPLPLDTGLDPGAGAIDFSPQRAPKPTKSPALMLDLTTPASPPGTLELDDPVLEIPASGKAPVESVLPPQPVRPSPLRDVALPGNPQRSALRDAGPSRGRPPTSPLEGLKSERPPERSGRSSLPPAMRPNLEISLDEIAPVQVPGAAGERTARPTGSPSPSPALAPPERAPVSPPATRTASAPKSKAARDAATASILDFALDEGAAAADRAPAGPDVVPGGAVFDLAPPERSAARSAPVAKSGLPDVGDFALEGFAAPAASPPPINELPKVTAASVMDLTLDEDELPIQRVPAPKPTKATPDISDFMIEDTPPPVSPTLRKAADDLDMVMPPTAARPAPAKPAGPAIPAMPAITKPSPVSVPAVPAVGSARPSTPGLIGGRYQKLGGAGVGSIGALYRGRDDSLARPGSAREVMIEELPRDVVLSVEPALLSRLDHANIVRFHEHVVDAAKSYVVTELVEGKSLEQLLSERGGTLASLEAIGIIDQVCSALGHAHERGVFHRAVRPGCVVISGRTAKLSGFGLSLGKPTPYHAPELVGGDPDERSDLYSVGVTLAQLLTGALPAPGKLDLPADVPRNLAQLIRKLVSREPMIRPANTKIVRDAFSSIF